MKKTCWLLLVLAVALSVQGCIIPRTAVGVAKGVTKGAVGIVKGAGEVATAPL